MANTPERQMHGGRGLGWLDRAGLAAIVDVASGLDLAAQGTCSVTAVVCWYCNHGQQTDSGDCDVGQLQQALALAVEI